MYFISSKVMRVSKNIIKYFFYLNPYLFYFYFKNLILPPQIRKVIFKLFPIIDPFIVFRTPKLKFKNKKLMIENIYLEDEEFREDPSPYHAFYRTMNETLDLNNMNSIIDIGCSTGHLINFIKKNYPLINVKGIEYFDFHKSLAPDHIKDEIKLKDIRDNFDIGKFDIVICTEVAEHIEPSYLINFLTNLKNATNKYLIMTWSNSYPNFYGPPQHVSSLSYKNYLKILKTFGFSKNTELTEMFINLSREEDAFNYWWRDSLVVFEISN